MHYKLYLFQIFEPASKEAVEGTLKIHFCTLGNFNKILGSRMKHLDNFKL